MDRCLSTAGAHHVSNHGPFFGNLPVLAAYVFLTMTSRTHAQGGQHLVPDGACIDGCPSAFICNHWLTAMHWQLHL